MGSGAKVALVALLILMVVAVAKFVQTGSDDAGQGGAGKKDVAGAPKFSPAGAPSSGQAALGQGKRPVVSNRAGAPAQAPGGTVAKDSPPPPPRTMPPPEPKPAPKTDGAPPSLGSAVPAAPPSPLPGTPPAPLESGKGIASPQGAAAVSGSLTPPAPKPPEKSLEGEKPPADRSEIQVASAPPRPGAGGNVSRDPGPALSGASGSAVPRTGAADGGPRLPGKEDPARPIAQKTSDGGSTAGPIQATYTFPVSHKVEFGENYWRLAEKYYGPGKGRLHSVIAGANGGARLIAGKTVTIPAPPAEASAAQTTSPGSSGKAAKAPPVIPSNTEGEFVYAVQKGDTLYGIAKKFNRKQADLESANPSLKFRTLKEGDRIQIPRR